MALAGDAEADAGEEDLDVPNGSGDLLASFTNLRGIKPEDPEAFLHSVELERTPPQGVTGILDNGLTYFVQENREPKARAELFLIVGFGSLVEDEHERGIAHIIEHLGFSATKSYENHAIVKFLESIGAPFGACQNAYTSFDRTVYTLHIPTDKEGILTESLTVLREFAFFTRISEEDLEKERKVVLEEWRESKNAQGRLFEDYIHALCKGCKWCERLPIGKEDVIRNVSAETLRSFYRRFYHPAKMAVVAVGDFDGQAVESTIKELFDIPPEKIEPLPRDPTGPERPVHPVPDTEGVLVASSTDPELSFAQGMVDIKRPRLRLTSVQGYRKRFAEELFHKALSSRLLKLIVEPKGPRSFFMVATETGEPIPPLNPMSITLSPLPGRMRPALRSILVEIERVKRSGFHESEVVRAKRSILAEFEEDYIERNNRSSQVFAEEYCSYFLDGQLAPGTEQRARLAASMLPAIPTEEVSRVSEEFNFEKNVVVKLATPPLSLRNPLYTCWSLLQACWNFVLPRPRLDLPNSTELSEIVAAVAKEEIEPWPADEDDVDARLRVAFEAKRAATKAAEVTAETPERREVVSDGVPKPVRGVSLSDLLQQLGSDPPVLGEEVVLANGLRIFLQDTDLFEDEIVVRGRRWGGLSEHQGVGLFGRRGVVSCEAQVCTMAAMMLGICGLSVESLQECLDGKRVEPNPPSCDAYTTSLDCHASPTDLEALLMLLNLLFLCPVEPNATSWGRLSLVKLGLLAWRLGENRDPQALFQRRVQEIITGDHPYTRLPSLWSILCLNFKKASSIFNERASRPCEWTLVLCGRLPSKDALLPLLEKYLGAIPNDLREASSGASAARTSARRNDAALREAVTPLEVQFPTKDIREEVRLKMIDPKGSTLLCFPISLASVTVVGSLESAEAELAELFRLRLLVRLLETRLVEVLRFKRGQVYGVSVGDDMSFTPPQLGKTRRGTLNISFECDPDEASELVGATKEELERLQDGTAAFTDENVSATLQQERREFEELFHKNDWWANTVLDLYFSRCNAVTGDISKTLAVWWRVRADVVGGFDAATAALALAAVLPKGANSAVITMRPTGKKKPAPDGELQSAQAKKDN